MRFAGELPGEGAAGWAEWPSGGRKGWKRGAGRSGSPGIGDSGSAGIEAGCSRTVVLTFSEGAAAWVVGNAGRGGTCVAGIKGMAGGVAGRTSRVGGRSGIRGAAGVVPAVTGAA